MYNLNMSGLIIPNPFISNPIQCSYPYAIHTDIPNVFVDSMGLHMINTKSRRDPYPIISTNIMYLQIFCYTSKLSKKSSDDIVEMRFTNNQSIFVKRGRVRGEYINDSLSRIGVDIRFSAPKTKQCDAINTMINKTINDLGIIEISSEHYNSLLSKCEGNTRRYVGD